MAMVTCRLTVTNESFRTDLKMAQKDAEKEAEKQELAARLK